MSNDPISRSSLRWNIRNNAPKYVPAWVYESIDKEPVAYNVEKVIERLKEEMNDRLNTAKEYGKARNFVMAEVYAVRADEYRNVIKIVEAGWFN